MSELVPPLVLAGETALAGSLVERMETRVADLLDGSGRIEGSRMIAAGHWVLGHPDRIVAMVRVHWTAATDRDQLLRLLPLASTAMSSIPDADVLLVRSFDIVDEVLAVS